ETNQQVATSQEENDCNLQVDHLQPRLHFSTAQHSSVPSQHEDEDCPAEQQKEHGGKLPQEFYEAKFRKRSIRRKNSFDRVRKLFEVSASTRNNRQLSRPLSVNLPYTPLEMSPVDFKSDLQRHKSNDDLSGSGSNVFSGSSTPKSSISKQFSSSSSSVCANDLYIIPSKTVYENVKFFESKVKQSLTYKGVHRCASL